MDGRRGDHVERLSARAAAGGVFTDFDGVLAPIVEVPDEATPVEGAVEALAHLLRRWARVGVVSGRPVNFLARHVPDPRVDLHGLYGLEYRRSGRLGHHPNAGAWRETVADVAELARRKIADGVRVEDKAVSLTVHYRERPDLAGAVTEFASVQARRSGLVARPAKMSIELHPPIEVDKGSVLRAEGETLDAVVYLGDDVGDLSGFLALDELSRSGREVLKVAVETGATPVELTDAADLVLADQDDAVRLLEALADGPPGG